MTQEERPPGLTADQIKRLIQMLEDQKRRAWALAYLRRVAGYIAAGLGAAIAFRDDLTEVIQWLFL